MKISVTLKLFETKLYWLLRGLQLLNFAYIGFLLDDEQLRSFEFALQFSAGVSFVDLFPGKEKRGNGRRLYAGYNSVN